MSDRTPRLSKGPRVSAGMRLLAAWMEREGVDQPELARRLGTDQPHVSRLLSGVSQPTLETVGKVVKVAAGSVTAADFLVYGVAPVATQRALVRSVTKAVRDGVRERHRAKAK